MYGQTTKETNPNGNIKTNEYDVLGLVLRSYAVGGTMAYKQYQNIEKINKQRKQEQFEKTVGKNFDQNVQDVINGTKGIDEITPSQKAYNNFKNGSKAKVGDNGSSKNKNTSKNKATNTSKQVVEKQTCPESESNNPVDILQFIIDVIGFFPVAGDICDAINALIYYARGKIMDAIMSVGSIVFSVVADTILKPIRWAGGKMVDIAKKISKEVPDFAKRTVAYIKSVPEKIKQIPIVRKGYDAVSNLRSKLSDYIDNLFKKAQQAMLGDYEDEVAQSLGNAFQRENKYWNKSTTFSGEKVYQGDDIFDINFVDNK